MEFNATFLVSIISFLCFVFIMNKIFYRPIENIMTERQKYIDGIYSDAKNMDNEADFIIKDREEKLQQSAHNAREVIKAKTDSAVVNANKITSDAREKSLFEIETQKNKLHMEADKLENEIEAEVETISDAIVKKVLGGVV